MRKNTSAQKKKSENQPEIETDNDMLKEFHISERDLRRIIETNENPPAPTPYALAAAE
jgi:hypothetical protein